LFTFFIIKILSSGLRTIYLENIMCPPTNDIASLSFFPSQHQWECIHLCPMNHQ
jgi:hypothetical protein